MFRWLKCPSTVCVVFVLIWETVRKILSISSGWPMICCLFSRWYNVCFSFVLSWSKSSPPLSQNKLEAIMRYSVCTPPPHARISLPLTKHFPSPSLTQTHTQLLIRVLYYAWKQIALRPTSFIIHQIWTHFFSRFLATVDRSDCRGEYFQPLNTD